MPTWTSFSFDSSIHEDKLLHDYLTQEEKIILNWVTEIEIDAAVYQVLRLGVRIYMIAGHFVVEGLHHRIRISFSYLRADSLHACTIRHLESGIYSALA